MRSLLMLTIWIATGVSLSPVNAAQPVEEPLTFRHAMNWQSKTSLAMKPVNLARILEEDNATSDPGVPLRVAVALKESTVNEFEKHGEWTIIDDMSVWRLRVTSPEASWLSFGFDNLFLPPRSSLFVYGENRQQVLGPYTDGHNKSSGTFWTPMVDGDVAFIEISVPTKLKSFLTFDLKSVNHGYRKLGAAKSQKSGVCNIDVVCPQGDNWRNEIRSVARYIFERNGGLLTCTGSLVNTTNGDRRPYFLTANHCVGTVSEARSMVLFWNFETSVCGGLPNGSSSQTQSGASLLATLGRLDGPLPERDMTLVELDSTPDASYNVFYSGWDADTDPPASGVSIHHPDGDEKRISIEGGPITKTGYLTAQIDPDGTHLRITAWDEGTTEEGSSGGGFWNSDRRLVGVLSGGAAACDNPDGSDFYAHLGAHYDVGSDSATSLKAWLDPMDTGATFVDGIDGCDIPAVSMDVTPNPAEVGQAVAFTSTINGVPPAGLTYSWDFDGDTNEDSSLASPTFTYPGTFVGNVELTVSTPSCDVTISQAVVILPQGGNIDPVAAAGFSAVSADEGSNVQLDGTASSDPNGDALTFLWEQVSGPAATPSSATDAAPTVVLPFVTEDSEVVFALTVTDEFGASATDQASIMVLNVNRAPVAIASPTSISVNEGSLVTLNAAASSDADGDSLTFAWAQTAGAVVSLSDASAATTTFTAPQVTAATTFTFAVTVTDTGSLSDSATVTVTVNNVEPVSTGGGGGGGALGWPALMLLLLAASLRNARRLVIASCLLSGALIQSACTPATPSPTTPSPATPQSIESAESAGVAGPVILTRLDASKSKARITDASHIAQMVESFNNRERRFEKIKPLYEYEIQMNLAGREETWQLSPSGYLQKAGSSELYKMDMSILKNYMN